MKISYIYQLPASSVSNWSIYFGRFDFVVIGAAVIASAIEAIENSSELYIV